MKRVTFVSKYIFSFFFLVGITASIVLFINLQSCKNPADSDGIDTTGTNYSWQKYTFGGAASSSLEDVAIIDSKNIWAVGKIYVYDSTGHVDPNIYNAVHWDGQKLSILKIPYYYQGQALYGAIYSICAFSENDIWFGIGNMIHWNGQSFSPVQLPPTV